MTITIPKSLAAPLASLGLLLVAFLASADSCGGGSNSAESGQVSNQQGIYNAHEPIPTYQYSNERAALIQILNQRTTGSLNTWTVWYSNNGTPLGMCASKGYPIPYSTELTNPLQVENGGTSSAVTSVGQMDPQGTYPSSNTLATWVLCIDPASGAIHPQYVEPMVIAYTYSVEIQGTQVVQTGKPGADSAITLPKP